MRNEIGAPIKAWRKHKGLTLTQVQKLTGINNGNLSKVERGVQSAKNDTIIKLAMAYGITPGMLLAGPDD